NCSTSHYSNIAIIYDSDLMCIHSLLWKKIVHIIMVYGQRTEARIQYRGTREESTRVSKERRNSEVERSHAQRFCQTRRIIMLSLDSQ
ncbi:unnamed protein product, partial [Rotaria magnacalcarata]